MFLITRGEANIRSGFQATTKAISSAWCRCHFLGIITRESSFEEKTQYVFIKPEVNSVRKEKFDERYFSYWYGASVSKM